MATLMAWCTFFGAWLLVAGPIYQAALELGQQQMVRERIEAVVRSVKPPPPVSAWWWLLPPVAFLLQLERARAYRKAHFAALSSEDRAAFVSYLNKAAGWQMVALGGLLLAVQQTHELCKRLSLGLVAFVVVSAGMAFASAMFTVARLRAEKGVNRS